MLIPISKLWPCLSCGAVKSAVTTVYNEKIVKYNKFSHQMCWGTTEPEERHLGGKRKRVKLSPKVLILGLIYYLVQ